MLRQLLDLSKKASGLPLEFSRGLGQFQFPLRFFTSPKTPTSQRQLNFNPPYEHALSEAQQSEMCKLPRPSVARLVISHERLAPSSARSLGGNFGVTLVHEVVAGRKADYFAKGNRKIIMKNKAQDPSNKKSKNRLTLKLKGKVLIYEGQKFVN
jgi:hypothetical protein